MQTNTIASATRYFSLKASLSQIKKLLLPAAFLVSFAFFAAPAVGQVTITTTSPGGALLTDTYTVTFTTAQTGLSASNFSVTGTATGAYVSSVTGSGTSWQVNVTIPGSFQSAGYIILNMVNSTGLAPGVSGLPVSGPSLNVVNYPLDGSLNLSSTNANPGYAKNGDKINFTLQSTHYYLEFWNVHVAGQNANGSLNFSNMATGQVTLGSGTAQGPIAWSWNYTNQYNESDNGSGTSSIIFDNIAPTATIAGPGANIVAGNGNSTSFVQYFVTYSDANFGSNNLTTSGITLNTTGTATGTVSVNGVGNGSSVIISNISGNGTLGISVGAGYATDLAGNTDAGAGPSVTTTVLPYVMPSISYTGPQAYTTNAAISPLMPTSIAGSSAFNTHPQGSTSGLALDYNGNVYFKASNGFIYITPPGNGSVALAYNGGNVSSTNLAIASISSTTSTIIFGAGPIISAMDYTNGVFQPVVNIIPEGAANLVAATHPVSGPEIAMICEGNTSQITFLTRTAGVWSAPSAIPNAFTTTAMAINTYQGGLKIAYVGTDNNLYYATYSGGAWSTVATWAAPNIGMSGVSAFTLDTQGNVWYTSGTSLYVLTPGSNTPVTMATLPVAANAIAFDIAGNLYVNYGALTGELQVPGGFQVNPALPAGLSINSTTGIISGTPTVLSAATNYMVTATTASGNLTAAVNIATITTPALSYGGPQNYVLGTSITPIIPTSTSIMAQRYNSTPATFASVTAPTGLAVDAAGNIYVNQNNGLSRFPAAGGTPTALISTPTGPIYIDAADNLYAPNSIPNVEQYSFGMYAPGASTTLIVGETPSRGHNFTNSRGIAVDQAGNVYVGSSSSNTVYEYPYYLSADGFAPVVIATGFTSVSGVAVDAMGDLYVSDAGAGSIDVIAASRGQWTTLASGLGAPANICIDGVGNLYFSDNSANTISEIPAGSITPVLIASGLGSITALAIDGQGNLFAADNTNGVIDKFYPTGGYYINPVLPAGLNFNGATGVISGTPVAVPTIMGTANYTITAYNTLGSASATQNITVPGTLPTLSYSSALSFTTGEAVAPLTPISSAVAAQGYNTIPVFMDYTFNAPFAVAVDTSLNVYVADPYNFTAGNLSYGTNGNYGNYVFPKFGGQPKYFTPTNEQLAGVAVDSAGNVFGAKSYTVPSKFTPSTAGFTETALPFGSLVDNVATDAHGDLFGTGGTTIQELALNAASTTTIGFGFSQPTGIAVDGPGNIFVVDRGANTLYKIPAGSNTPTAVATGFNLSWQLAADGTGNIFIADGGNGVVKELPAGGGAVTTVISNLKTPNGVAVDINGALYVADAGFAQVRKYTPSGGYYISPALPAGLTFNNATGAISGTPTAVTSPKNYKITAYNLAGSTQTTIRIDVTPPSSNLAGLTVSAGSLSPAFTTATTGYSVSAPYTSSQITVMPTPVDGSAMVTVNGTAVAYGNLSAPVSLQVGSNTITIVVTASDHSSTKTYTLTVTRAAASNNAQLTAVGLGYGTDGSGNTYAIVTPIAAGVGATVTVNGTAVVSGAPSNPILLSPGSNTLIITVTAQNGVTKLTYKITVEGPLSGVSTLSSLTISAGTLSPAFSGTTTSYTDNVTNAIPSITVTPTTTDPNATVTVNAAAVTSGTPSSAIGLNVGNNTIATIVTAQDGVTTTTYTITVTRAAPPNDNLSAFKLSTGTLSPAFAAATTGYTASAANTVTSVTITPTLSDPTASVTVNGTPVTSGAASAAIPLNLGPNTINTVVTARDGVSTKTYALIFTRIPSSNALLASIATTPVATLVGTTGTGYLNFTAAVPNSTASIQVVPTAKDATATITVNGTPVVSGAASQSITLPVGQTVITTVITAQDGITTKTIIITVTRAPSSNAGLSNIVLSSGILSPAFVSTTTSYGASVNDIGSVTFTPTTADPGATLTVNGTAATSSTGVPIALVKGANTITTVVTAQDGKTTKTYNTTVTLVAGTNAQIATIATTPVVSLVGTTGTGYLNFKASVPNSFSSIQEIVTLKDPLATMTINGTPATSGTASQAIALPVGQTVITTVITAQDGVTQKTVILTVTRAPSGNAGLSNITLNSGTLTPAFVTSTISYKASVSDIGSITITPTTADPTATLTVNGAVATSGTGVPITLVNGANTITTVVTAQDGTTKKTYTTVVTLTPGTNAQIATIATTPVVSLAGATGTGYLNFKASVPNSFSSIQEIVTLKDPLATMTVNGTVATSGSPSQAIALAVGANTITTVITAQDGVTQKTVIVTITRAAPPVNNSLYQEGLSMNKPTENVSLNDDGIVVHQALSPNGDGVNDVLTIENITNYPDNHLTIVDRNGNMVYEAKGYDNATKLFDGHSNGGKMQLPGTYFYSLSYTVKGETRRLTGFIILKY